MYQSSDQAFAVFFNENILPIKELFCMGENFLNTYFDENVIKNKFWNDTLLAWKEMCQKIKISKLYQAYSSPLWLNPKISEEALYYPTWYSKGISLVGDLINSDGSIMSIEDIKNNYNLDPINYLNYLSIRTLVRRYLRIHHFLNELNDQPPRPFISIHLQTIIQNRKGSRHIYNVFISDNNITMKDKWDEKLNTQIDVNQWKVIHNICFNTLKDNYLIWLQYKIINRILGTKELRYKMNIFDTPLCSFCGNHDETLIHIFYQCDQVRLLWDTIMQWILRKTNININLSEQQTLLGYSSGNNNQIPVNTILICTKAYIFYCARTNKRLNIYHLQDRIKRTYLEQEFVSKRNNKELQFNATWNRWKTLFENI